MTNDELKSTGVQTAPANSLKKKKKHKGIESLKSTYGRLFVLHWEIGLVLFFIVPIFKSLYYAFCGNFLSLYETICFGKQGLCSVHICISNA